MRRRILRMLQRTASHFFSGSGGGPPLGGEVPLPERRAPILPHPFAGPGRRCISFEGFGGTSLPFASVSRRRGTICAAASRGGSHNQVSTCTDLVLRKRGRRGRRNPLGISGYCASVAQSRMASWRRTLSRRLSGFRESAMQYASAADQKNPWRKRQFPIRKYPFEDPGRSD
jgi:hypothetical protein